MAAIGGSIQEISIDARPFAVAADSDPGRGLGGKKNEVSMNGDGQTFRVLQEIQASKIDAIDVQIDDDNEDQEYIQSKIDAGLPITLSVTYASGKIYSGQVQITGDAAYSPKNATMSLTFEGGVLRKV
jgi:hypothetical protein